MSEPLREPKFWLLKVQAIPLVTVRPPIPSSTLHRKLTYRPSVVLASNQIILFAQMFATPSEQVPALINHTLVLLLLLILLVLAPVLTSIRTFSSTVCLFVWSCTEGVNKRLSLPLSWMDYRAPSQPWTPTTADCRSRARSSNTSSARPPSLLDSSPSIGSCTSNCPFEPPFAFLLRLPFERVRARLLTVLNSFLAFRYGYFRDHEVTQPPSEDYTDDDLTEEEGYVYENPDEEGEQPRAEERVGEAPEEVERVQEGDTLKATETL